jgi:hypothetical protein
MRRSFLHQSLPSNPKKSPAADGLPGVWFQCERFDLEAYAGRHDRAAGVDVSRAFANQLSGRPACNPDSHGFILVHRLDIAAGVIAGSNTDLVSAAPGITSPGIDRCNIPAGVIALANADPLIAGFVIARALLKDHTGSAATGVRITDTYPTLHVAASVAHVLGDAADVTAYLVEDLISKRLVIPGLGFANKSE